MQAPKRLSVKLFADNPDAVEVEALVPVFQRWIQETAIENELLIDVVDYKHVHHGPGIMLIAHEGDYAYQFNEGRVGLSYTIKQHNESSLTDVLSLVLARVTHVAELIKGESSLNGLTINLDTVQVTFLDRLRFPNDEPTSNATQDTLSEIFSQHSSDATITRIESDDSRDPLRFEVQSATEISPAISA